jgi:hypothetical protein
MRTMLRSVLLALVAALTLGAVASASAFASPEWQLNGKPVTESTPVTLSTGVFEARLLKTSFGQIGVSCSISGGKGTVEPKGKGSITEFTITNCKRKEICKEGTESVSVLHLSWKTELVEDPKVDDRFGTGVYGWEWKCGTALGSFSVACKRKPGLPTTVENTSLEGVLVRWHPETREECTEKLGAGTGKETEGAEQAGEVHIRPPAGDTLEY